MEKSATVATASSKEVADTAVHGVGPDMLAGSVMLLQTAVVQGLGPSGWFDAATAAEFELPDDDMVSATDSVIQCLTYVPDLYRCRPLSTSASVETGSSLSVPVVIAHIMVSALCSGHLMKGWCQQ
jgi:hypothetical protein